MQPSYRRKKFVSYSYFAIGVYKKGYLRNVFYHQKIQRGMNMAILTNTISKLSSIIPQAYNANNGHPSITTWQNSAQTLCAWPHPTTSHRYYKPG